MTLKSWRKVALKGLEMQGFRQPAHPLHSQAVLGMQGDPGSMNATGPPETLSHTQWASAWGPAPIGTPPRPCTHLLGPSDPDCYCMNSKAHMPIYVGFFPLWVMFVCSILLVLRNYRPQFWPEGFGAGLRDDLHCVCLHWDPSHGALWTGYLPGPFLCASAPSRLLCFWSEHISAAHMSTYLLPGPLLAEGNLLSWGLDTALTIRAQLIQP